MKENGIGYLLILAIVKQFHKFTQKDTTIMMYTELFEESDIKNIKEFLQNCGGAQLNPDFHTITGFLYGLAMTPEDIDSEEWLGYIVEEQSDGELDNDICDILTRVFEKHVAAFNEDRLAFPFNLSHMLENNGEIEPLVNWVKGFVDALYLRSSFWDGETFIEFDTDRQQLLYHSMLMIEGIIEPEMVKEVFEKLPIEVLRQVYPTLDLQSDTVYRQIAMICIMACPDAVKVLQQYSRDLAAIQQDPAVMNQKPGGKVIKVDFTGKVKK